MELKLDIKTLVVGIALGVIITAVLGAVGSADKADFGVAIENKGSALVKTQDGNFYIVNAENGVATRVLEARSLSADPDDQRPTKSNPFNISGPGVPSRSSTRR